MPPVPAPKTTMCAMIFSLLFKLMLTLGAQQPCQSITLLLRSAYREQVVQVVVVAPCFAPFVSEMHNHDTHLGLHAMFMKIVAQEADDLPVLFGQNQAFFLCTGARKFLRPVIQVLEITLGIGLNFLAINQSCSAQRAGHKAICTGRGHFPFLMCWTKATKRAAQ